LIPANNITNGFFTSRDSLISPRKLGGFIRIDSIESFSSVARSTSFRDLLTSFSSSESLIDSTAPYATLFCNRIISSSSKSSLNFSSVSFFWNFEKKPFFFTGASIVSSRDCSSSSFGSSLISSFIDFFFAFLTSFSSFFSISFFGAFTFTFFTGFSIPGSSSFFVTHFLSFAFSEPNMFFRGILGLRTFWFGV